MSDPDDTTVTGDLPISAPAGAPLPSTLETVAALPSLADVLVDGWMDEFLRNSPIARSTEAWNHLISTALPALKARLAKGL